MTHNSEQTKRNRGSNTTQQAIDADSQTVLTIFSGLAVSLWGVYRERRRRASRHCRHPREGVHACGGRQPYNTRDAAGGCTPRSQCKCPNVRIPWTVLSTRIADNNDNVSVSVSLCNIHRLQSCSWRGQLQSAFTVTNNVDVGEEFTLHHPTQL